MNTSKFALLLLLLVGAAVGAFFLLQGEGGNELPPRPPIQPADITTTEYITPIRADSNWNGLVWEFYVFVALFFFAFCFCMSRYSMYLEKKLKTDNH